MHPSDDEERRLKPAATIIIDNKIAQVEREIEVLPDAVAVKNIFCFE